MCEEVTCLFSHDLHKKICFINVFVVWIHSNLRGRRRRLFWRGRGIENKEKHNKLSMGKEWW
jgi:hypothetical protein